ncbi:MAG: PEP/pyruvate-binding domain-containing protein, partial [Tenuifilaceae bacterium]|nr:PEP/pyruvate-binding domain-containing protein [Tenuifilaceae bacterium]
FAFGDFIFINPSTGREIFRAEDLKGLQDIIFKIPDESLAYHIQRNHFTKWLTARALFSIADVLKYITLDDFENLDEVRRFVFNTIDGYRQSEGRGIISEFYSDSYDEYQIFSRIGDGSLGGKGRGLAFMDQIIKQNSVMHKYSGVLVTIPQTVVICTDVFDEFMEANNLYSIALSDTDNNTILEHFLGAQLPARIEKDLLSFIALVQNPVAIRSSSLLEDSHYQQFTGIYKTYMIPNVANDTSQMLGFLCQAIKSVYASVYYSESKAYLNATQNVISEEHMAVVLQEVTGTTYGKVFYPNISGVAQSVNFNAIKPDVPSDGIVSIALGLGKHVIDGKPSLHFSPKHPKKLLQLSTPEKAIKETQKTFYALNLDSKTFKPSTNEGLNLLTVDIKDAFAHGTLGLIGSAFDSENNRVNDGYNGDGVPIISFTGVLKHEKFPLAEIISDILALGQREMNNPVEIEFAVKFSKTNHKPHIFNVLQIRPIVREMSE